MNIASVGSPDSINRSDSWSLTESEESASPLEVRHDLGKYVMALLHRGLLRGDVASCAQIRSPTEIETASKSLFYVVLQNVSLLPTCNVGTVVGNETNIVAMNGRSD